ncbi:hypothetical protein HanRHA438_Chr00c02g0843281 [Helianthus annuus]|uniref:Uncharacterized protein n=1 Tax=Helianthus annuus TaxID=4232 RepID=A0A251UBP3_HELAN|nr:hypothetical protein HanXRQr2_Chr07g0304471 [Helianthus annuus]KAJ0563844.1 hypothetical protein HanHA89_Chr07g0267671 [Helianthus annuus]KAJ0729181.1 hypothetical protein HanLR1_Chr07g0250071 [Helianthus annuus]KAJ0905508.1 hypothetical protein HanPSC8_Chr07g0294791 [Helianthus annuus]KAJ0955057.1 hypothetical protein HanRHA438_Chr00c02g0843281 [Helianthus annuus]
MRFTGSQIIMSLGLTIEHEELLDSKVTQLVKKILLCRGTFISYSYAAESIRMQWVECWINIFYPQTRSIVNPTSFSIASLFGCVCQSLFQGLSANRVFIQLALFGIW